MVRAKDGPVKTADYSPQLLIAAVRDLRAPLDLDFPVWRNAAESLAVRISNGADAGAWNFRDMCRRVLAADAPPGLLREFRAVLADWHATASRYGNGQTVDDQAGAVAG